MDDKGHPEKAHEKKKERPECPYAEPQSGFEDLVCGCNRLLHDQWDHIPTNEESGHGQPSKLGEDHRAVPHQFPRDA